MSATWPVEFERGGIIEAIVTTREPTGTWNVAALGLHAGDPVTSRTWGDTRTRRNFEREGAGYVQFTRDPVDFVEAALSIREESDPILDSADAWVQTAVERIDTGVDEGTRWRAWTHEPIEVGVDRRVVPTTNRGYYAVIEATVAASRLDVDAYEEPVLRDRLVYLESIVERCGGSRTLEAFDRLRVLSGWEADESRTNR